MLKYIISVFLIVVVGLAPVELLAQPDSILLKYGSSITSDELKKHLYELASDKYEGRETGREGQKEAAAYLVEQFKSYGYSGLNGTFYQEFPIKITHPQGGEITIDGKEFKFYKDFYYLPGFKDLTVETEEILFMGYGIDDKKYSDYKDIDIKNKWILIMSSEPFKKGIGYVSEKNAFSDWNAFRKKVSHAKESGAKGVFIISSDYQAYIEKLGHYLTRPRTKLDIKGKDDDMMLPYFFLSKEMAKTILDKENLKLEKVEQKISKKGKTIHKKIAVKVKIKVDRRVERLFSENVLAYIEGKDKKDEVIVITAHYDHIGIVDGEIYNGADDDGTGTVALLEMAQAFSEAKKNGHGPRRSILIMPVSGEEKGLLGSGYYSQFPIFPLDNTVANLNIDMIGRLDEAHADDANYVYLIGADMLSTDLHDVSEQINNTYCNITLDYTYNKKDDPNRFYYRSDHYNFAKNGVPCIFYFNGVHADYHKPTDTVDKIDFKKTQNITRLVFYTAWELANRTERIRIDKEEKPENK